jgi:isopentenyl diphosphate isomerase/L-lactate dehydrogenase-like FMN-dependent dehydrogenase
MRDELERAMALTGRRSIAEIDSTVLWREEDMAIAARIRRAPAGA